jgi:tol-pal system protein YbgF
MLKQSALLLLALGFVNPAQAGLLQDDEARKQILQLEARVVQLEDDVKHQAQLEDDVKRQTKSMLDLQSQIDSLNREIRNLRGQNEEIAHGLQDAEKRQKDFYVDLDTRVRHFESAEQAAKDAAAAAAKAPADPSDPVPEDRAFEAAYGIYKSGKYANAAKAFQDFIKQFPESVRVPNAHYWLGSAQLAQKDYKNAMATYQKLLKDFPATHKAPDAMYGIANCLKGLDRSNAARKTLKQLAAKYPASEAAAKAKKQLAAKK